MMKASRKCFAGAGAVYGRTSPAKTDVRFTRKLHLPLLSRFPGLHINTCFCLLTYSGILPAFAGEVNALSAMTYLKTDSMITVTGSPKISTFVPF